MPKLRVAVGLVRGYCAGLVNLGILARLLKKSTCRHGAHSSAACQLSTQTGTKGSDLERSLKSEAISIGLAPKGDHMALCFSLH